MSYKPRGGTKVAEIVAWFEANPGVALTSAEVASQFSMNVSSISTTLRAACQGGALARYKDGPSFTYELGTGAPPRAMGNRPNRTLSCAQSTATASSPSATVVPTARSAASSPGRRRSRCASTSCTPAPCSNWRSPSRPVSEAAMSNTTEITVKLSSGSHVTSTVNGNRASSTMSAQAAAERLGEKVYGPALKKVSKMRDTTAGVEIWKLVPDDTWVAFAWASGLIGFSVPSAVPEGAVAFARGPERSLRQLVAVLAREGKGKSQGKLLVPGVVEAENQHDGMTAMIEWTNWCALRNGKGHAFGVVFESNAHEAA